MTLLTLVAKILTGSERAGLVAVLKVETITIFPIVELNPVDARKGGPEGGAADQPLGDAADKEIDVLVMPSGVAIQGSLRNN